MPFLNYQQRKLFIRLSLFIFLPILVIASAYGYIWYQTKVIIDQYLSENSQFVQVKYDSIKPKFSGRIDIERINIFSIQYKQTFTINKISLKTNNLIDLVKLPYHLKHNQLPDQLAIDIQGFLAPVIQYFSDSQNHQYNFFNKLFTLGCKDIQAFDYKFLKAINYDNFDMDIYLNFQLNRSSKQLQLIYSHDIKELYDINLDLTIDNINEISMSNFLALIMMPSRSETPTISTVKFQLQDDLFQARKNVYCGNLTGQSSDNYINNHTKLFNNYLKQNKLLISNALNTAYQVITKDSPKVSIEANFSGVDSYLELINLTPNQLIQKLDLKLQLNDNEIKPITIDLQTNEELIKEVKTVKTNKLDKIKEQHYQTIHISNASKYNGYPAILFNKEGKQYQGQLKVNGKYNLEIQTRKQGGVFGYNFEIDDVKSLQVYK